MILDDSTGRPSKRILSLLILLALNAGTAHILLGEITARVSAQGISLIKDEQVSLDEAGTASSGDPINSIATQANKDEHHEISSYTVKDGDTISDIAEEYGISTDTVRSANNLTSKATIKSGDILVILPISGILYTVEKGDTLSGIADHYDAHSQEILTYNDLTDAHAIKPGMKLIIPGGVETVPSPVVKKVAKKEVAIKTTPTTSTASKNSSYYKNPVQGAVLTQGKHDSTAVDFGTPIGTTVKAVASGTVTIAKGDGDYNGGYGNYIMIAHANGTSTLYGHLSSVAVKVGDKVSQGQVIGKSGNTGRSTGPHLHLEVRGATNPFFSYKVGTRF